MAERKFKSVRRKFTTEEQRRFEAGKRWAEANRGRLQREANAALDQMETNFAAMQLLKAEREQQGVSLGELAKRTGIDKSNLSKLENDINSNPKVATLARIAKALGKRLELTLKDAA